MKKPTILIFCAHSDDEAVGMAGTIAKYVAEGKEVVKVVFSFGESSHPHFQESVVIRKRVKETDQASQFLGMNRTVFLGMKDTKVAQDLTKKRGKAIIKRIIDEYKPERIYVPSGQDPHPDHQAVNRIVLEVVDGLRKKYDVYAFEVWNVIKEQHPFVFVDITPYFGKKLDYMGFFRSQWQYMYALMLPVHIRSRIYGGKAGCKYAERFYKLR